LLGWPLLLLPLLRQTGFRVAALCRLLVAELQVQDIGRIDSIVPELVH
jgi:hypothetical protein